MAAPKGNKFSHGKPLGTKNKKTAQWEVFSEYMLGGGLEKFQRELNSLEGDKFVRSMIDLMEFFKPKLARTELMGKDGKDLPQPIVNVFENNSNVKNNKPIKEN